MGPLHIEKLFLPPLSGNGKTHFLMYPSAKYLAAGKCHRSLGVAPCQKGLIADMTFGGALKLSGLCLTHALGMQVGDLVCR